jgi:predicted enzyme related to lactoylglutathione lyase
VPVSDQDRACAFYRDVLGMEVLADQSMGEMRWLQLRPPESECTLTLVTWFPTMPPGSLKGLVLRVVDIEATAAQLREQGIPIEGIEEAPWGRFVQIDDPDGNGLILQQSAG